MGKRAVKVDKANFVVAAGRWLHQAGYAVDLSEAALDNDRMDDIARKLVAGAVALVHPPAALSALAGTVVPSDARADDQLSRVLSGLEGTADVLGVKQALTLTRLICFVNADWRDGEQVARAMFNLARAANSMNTFYREVIVEAVFYYLTPPSQKRVIDVVDALPEDATWGAENNVDLIWRLLLVNGDVPWIGQPEDDMDDQTLQLLLQRYEFVYTAIPELLGKAEELQAADR